MSEPQAVELSPEDKKLVTLARATRARTGAAEGAAVRGSDGTAVPVHRGDIRGNLVETHAG